ncbi:hypothetical protein HQ590_13985, partial [bacterium]|nr:hypothetical protein [bacterium]
MIEQIQNSLSSVFTPELLAATLVLALMTSTVVVGLFAHRARGAPGGPDHLWAIGWLLFLVYLAAALADQALLGQGGLGVFRDAAVGLCGLFLLWGNQAQSQLFRSRRELGLATVLVMLGSYAGHE